MAKKAKRKRQSPKHLRVAMIGAGGRAVSTHYPALADISGVEIAAVCDLNEDLMSQAADRFAIPGRYTSYKQMIETEKPDAVYAIMPPHHLHDVAATILEMGCNLFIEKPPSVTTEQLRQLNQIAARNKLITGVTFQRRFAPLIRRGKELCEKQGPIHTVHSNYYKNHVGNGPYYQGAIDILMCDGIHAVDTLRYLGGGEVESVAADSRRLDADFWNMNLAMVRFSSGVTGILLVNFMAGFRTFHVEIHSPGASYFCDPEIEGRLHVDNEVEPTQRLDPFELSGATAAYRAFGGFDTSLHFVDCLRRGVQPETCFADGIKTMELVDAVYASQI